MHPFAVANVINVAEHCAKRALGGAMLADVVTQAGLRAAVFNVAGSSLRSACVAATLAVEFDNPNVRIRACNPDDRMVAVGRVPVYAAGGRRPAVRRTPEVRDQTTGMLCSAVGRVGPVGGA